MISPTRGWTHTLLHWKFRVLTTGPSSKSFVKGSFGEKPAICCVKVLRSLLTSQKVLCSLLIVDRKIEFQGFFVFCFFFFAATSWVGRFSSVLEIGEIAGGIFLSTFSFKTVNYIAGSREPTW